MSFGSPGLEDYFGTWWEQRKKTIKMLVYVDCLMIPMNDFDLWREFEQIFGLFVFFYYINVTEIEQARQRDKKCVVQELSVLTLGLTEVITRFFLIF